MKRLCTSLILCFVCTAQAAPLPESMKRELAKAGIPLDAVAVEVRELDESDAAAIVALELASESDFPYTPAMAHRATTADEVREWPARGRRAFGAIASGELVALCVGRGGDNDFVTVARPHRRAGIGTAVVAAWMLAAIEAGESAFTAGGAAQNAGSLGMIRAIGFTVDERWLSLQRR